jgi:hypothetical protein
MLTMSEGLNLSVPMGQFAEDGIQDYRRQSREVLDHVGRYAEGNLSNPSDSLTRNSRMHHWI